MVVKSLKMPGKVLKSVDWIVDVPKREEIVGEGKVSSPKFAINCNGVQIEMSMGVYFNCK